MTPVSFGEWIITIALGVGLANVVSSASEVLSRLIVDRWWP